MKVRRMFSGAARLLLVDSLRQFVEQTDITDITDITVT